MTGLYIFTFADILYRSSIYSLFNWLRCRPFPTRTPSTYFILSPWQGAGLAGCGKWIGEFLSLTGNSSRIDRLGPSLSTDSLSCNACELASLYFQPTFPCSFTGSLVKYGTNTALGKLHVLQNYVFLDQNYWFDKFFI